jgi:chorismate mutase
MKKTLEDLRKEIDEADEQILSIFAKRFEIVREIGKLKYEQNIAPLDEKRWQEVVSKIIETSKKYHIPEEFIKNIYEEIHKTALKIEHHE